MPHLWDSDEGICREWEHDDASRLAAEAFAAGQAVGFTCYGTLLVAAARVPRAKAEMLAFLPKTLQEKWNGYEIVKKKKEIDDAHIGMLDYTK